MGKQSVSVAICTQNGGMFIQEQLDRIVFQSRLPDKLVICDDRSTDDTAPIIEKFAISVPFTLRFYIDAGNLRTYRLNLCQAILYQ